MLIFAYRLRKMKVEAHFHVLLSESFTSSIEVDGQFPLPPGRNRFKVDRFLDFLKNTKVLPEVIIT